MNLGELKKALKRFSSDLDDSEIVFMFDEENGTTNYDLLSFVAYTELEADENPVLVLGSMKTALKKIKEGKIKLPNEGDSPEQTFNLD